MIGETAGRPQRQPQRSPIGGKLNLVVKLRSVKSMPRLKLLVRGKVGPARILSPARSSSSMLTSPTIGSVKVSSPVPRTNSKDFPFHEYVCVAELGELVADAG